MATSLTQGDVLPAVTTGKQTQTTVPEFYSNYLQDITNLGRNAVVQGGVAGLSPLQQQAINMAPETAFAGAGSAGAGADLLTQAGYTMTPNVVTNYMNPFTNYMTDEMGRLATRGIKENVLPNLQAGAIGSGNFGSRRMADVAGQTLRDISDDLYGKQMGALATGYQNAMTNAQNDLTRGVQAGANLGNLATQQQSIGSGALTTLTNLGKGVQDQVQKQLDYPMNQAKAYSGLLTGQSIPTGMLENQISPGQAGNFDMSPLNQILQLVNALMAVNKGQPADLAGTGTEAGTTSGASSVLGKADGGAVNSMELENSTDYATASDGYFYGDDGSLYDQAGNLVG